MTSFYRCFTLLFLVASYRSESVVRPTKMWRFLGDDDRALAQKFRESLDEFAVERVKCLRYCIESKMTEDPKWLELIWNLEDQQSGPEMGSATSVPDNDLTPEVLRGDTNDSRNIHCTFSIVTGCNIPKGKLSNLEENFVNSLKPGLKSSNDKSVNFLNERLVDKSGLANETEIGFRVQPHQAEVNVIVLGNVTKIDLKIPLGDKDSSQRTTRLTLASTSAERATQELATRLKVRNPPPGGWRVILTGGGDRSYRVFVDSALVPDLDTDGTKKENGMSSRQLRLDQDQDMNDGSSVDQQYAMGMVYDDESPDNVNEQRPFQFPADPMSAPVNVSTRLGTEQIQDRILTDQRALTEGNFNSLGSQELPLRKYLNVELNPNSNLIASPGTEHELTFDITNGQIIPVVHYVSVITPLRNFLHPTYRQMMIQPGQTVSVMVKLLTPPSGTDSAYKVSLMVDGFTRVEKTVNLYVRSPGSRIYDDTKPWLNYYFNNNCNGRTSAEKCSKSYWSVDITVQDSDSGLKSMSSSPTGVYPYTEYLSGSTSPVYFYYTSNCCNRVIRVSAMDLSGNVYTQEIDVGVWYNMSGGEITAVVLGVLFVLLIIVLIVLSVLYCKQRQSHDLPYSTRYGSRASPRSAE